MNKRIRNDEIYSEILMEPCYYLFKKNAGLLKPNEYQHLKNLQYLFNKKQGGFYLTDHQLFTNKNKG